MSQETNSIVTLCNSSYDIGKKEGSIKELERIISYTNDMAKNITEQGVPDLNFFDNKEEALALYGFTYIKRFAENRILELKGEK